MVGATGDFPAGWQVMTGEVERLEREGFTWTATVRCGGQTVVAVVDRHMVLNRGLTTGSPVSLGFSGKHLHHMPDAA